MKIELASVGRMRIAFASRALPLAAATEIRGRTDLYGHVLVWPNGSQYRVLPPGAVRTLLGERRIDAVPLVRPQSTTRGEGQRRLGLATKKWDLSTRSGKLSLEQAKIPNSGEGGALLCRLLSELVSIDPSAAPCATDEVPLRAQITWPGSGGGGVVLEAIAINEKVELATSTMLVPPPGGEFVPASLPPFPAAVFLSREELAALRLRPLELPARSVGAPDDGLLVFNGTDSLRYAFVDTVPVGWVAPGRELLVPGLVRGRYLVQWRTFLGDAVEAPSLVEVPARIAIGVASSVALDAGR
jgi:hypothetical protein